MSSPVHTVVSASALRNNIYSLLDQVVETTQPLVVERKGRRLTISSDAQGTKLSRLVRHDCLRTDPESLVHMDWSKEWKHDTP